MEVEKLVVKLHDVNYIPAYKEAEETRQANESERQTAESIRELNEMTRETNETNRIKNENERIANENERNSYYTEFQERVNSGEFKGETAITVNVGDVTTGEPGTNASVINSGNDKDLILDFTIPRGTPGKGEGDYNNLDNIPIKRLSGSYDNPVVLRNLDVGIYLITGWGCYNDLDKECYSFIPEIYGVTEEIIVAITVKNDEKSRATIFGNGYNDFGLCSIFEFTDEQETGYSQIKTPSFQNEKSYGDYESYSCAYMNTQLQALEDRINALEGQ